MGDPVTVTVSKSSSSDWSNFHEDVLNLILKKLTSVSDCLRFGAVCVPWRNLLVSHLHPDFLHPQLPLLLIPTPSSSSSSSPENQTRSFYNITEKRIYKDMEIKLPYNRHCRGSSFGWLITSGLEDTDFAVELINPLVSINNEYLKIKLPPLTALPPDPDHDIYGYEYLSKAILTANPLTNPKDYLVMAIYGGYNLLAYWKPGEEIWNPVPWSGGGAANIDLIYYKDLFYICNSQGSVFVCDLGHRPNPKVWKIASSPIPKYPAIEKYLVKLPYSGELLMVHRYHLIETTGNTNGDPHSTRGFIISKLLLEEEEEEEERPHIDTAEEELAFHNNHEKESRNKKVDTRKWKRMVDLENQMLFVGDNASISLNASEFSGGKPNHIYFTCDCPYDHESGFMDIGILHYMDWTVEQIHPMGSNHCILPVTAIWIQPTLRSTFRF